MQVRIFRAFTVASLLLTSLMLQSAWSADADEEGALALQEVVVTGSLISRTDNETPSPVQVLSAQQIEQSGYTNISQILQNISSNGANTLNQAFPGAFASGASGVSLRGLTVADTLVLIDGHRTVDYPLADDNERSFVDISAIPINAIDHIDVLKDGASAIYGAQAIGGVVNVILKKSYTGAEVTAEAGTSEKNDGTLEHFAAILGAGDLVNDGYNAYVTLDFHHQDQILASNRHGPFTNLNWTAEGGVNTTPGAGSNPFAWNLPVNGVPASITGYLLNPTTGGTPYAFLPGCNAALQAADKCTYTLPHTQIQPATEQINILGKFTKTLGENWEGHVEASFFNSKADQVEFNWTSTAAPVGLAAIVFSPANPRATVVPPVPIPVTVPANYPGNPFGVPADLVYNFHELGPAGSVITTNTDTYRLVAEVNGKAAGWSIDGSVGEEYSNMFETFYGAIDPTELQAALNSGYVVGLNPSPNGASLFAPPMTTSPTSSLTYAEVHGSRPLMDLPGGPLSLALGGQYFHTVQNDTAPAASISGAQLQSGGPTFTVGTQEDAAVFTELDAQVFKQLELNGAVRYDHFDTYGSSTTPKFGVKFQPFEMLALRGTWSKGFRAPSAAEGQNSEELFSSTAFTDPVLCPNINGPKGANSPGNFPSQCSFTPTSVETANPNLKAVKSTSYTAGFVFEPAQQFNVSADYYNIKLTNDIISSSEAGGPSDFQYLVRNISPVTLPFVSPSGALVNATTPVGTVQYIGYSYLNAGETNTSGFDIDLRGFYELSDIGKFSANLSYTHLISYSVLATAPGTTAAVLYQLAGTHGPSFISGDTGNPKDRAVLTLGYDRGPLDVTTTINYTGTFSITDPSSGQFTCTEALDSNLSVAYGPRFAVNSPPSNSFCSVHTFVDVDLYGRYNLSKNFAVHGSIVNLFNRDPPLDLATYGGGGNLAYDTAFGGQTGAIGRFFTIGATYKF